MGFVDKIRNNAHAHVKKIVLAEGFDPRVLKAAEFLHKNQLVSPILLGDPAELKKLASENNVDLTGIEIQNPKTSDKLEAYADEFYELRKHKGISHDDARKAVENHLYFGAMMVRKGEVAGGVAGSVATTGDVLRAAIQVIGVAPGIQAVSSSFVMVLKDGREFTFGDCAVIPNPDVEQLASIAISSANTHRRLVGEEPRVAMLSFSTKGSAKHPRVDKVLEALQIAKQAEPDLKIDGELQVDAAILPEIGATSLPIHFRD